MSDLFPEDRPTPGVVVVPDTLDRLVAVFLNRWHWRGDRAVVERELRALIAEARDLT